MPEPNPVVLDPAAPATVLVTGGAGFIGGQLVRRLLAATTWRVVTLDALTYAGSLASLGAALDDPRHTFVEGDVRDASLVRRLLAEHRPAAIAHLAAESHVDRSIDAPAVFLETNVVGTHVLLQEALRHWRTLPPDVAARFRLLHVSTDEVFGSLALDDARFDERSAHAPSSPYAASKAAADHLVRAWTRTYGLPCLTTHGSNTYGPFQFPEKLIPLATLRARRGEAVPVYGDGANVRDWLHVEDHADALLAALVRGRVGETYGIGGGNERANLDVVRRVCALVDALAPAIGRPRAALIAFVADRPGHDLRYALDTTKARHELGWRPVRDFDAGLRATVAWYLANERWCASTAAAGYRQERLGLGRPA